MCGIFASCESADKQEETSQESCDRRTQLELVGRRGNHELAFQKIAVTVNGRDYELRFGASVLHLRGATKTHQPRIDAQSGSVLLFNGEIFDGQVLEGNESECSDTDALSRSLARCVSDREIADCFASIRGPFAFVYWDNIKRKLWFGRDILGRRSLCQRQRDDTAFEICSVGDSNDNEWVEVPANGFYTLDAESLSDGRVVPSLRFAWQTTVAGDVTVASQSAPPEFVKSPIGCALNRHLADKSDEATASESTIKESVITEFIRLLSESVATRATSHNFLCRLCVELSSRVTKCEHPSVAVLFSGGIDSTMIALLADKHLPVHIPIDLLNVAFDVSAPDRLTGRAALDELRKLCPQRKWNFVVIDVTRDELIKARSETIKRLIFPLKTVIDDSIGCSLWFASRGSGTLDGDDYECPARVLLHGLGADEQLAGYSRHRRVFDSQGWPELIEEIALEINRLSFRNLGRDDRIVSDHSREARFPFLDERLVSFLNSLPITQKCDLNETRGVGEKKLLRLAARRLGLVMTSTNEKRAIQFGTRIAKLENKKEKGDMRCERLLKDEDTIKTS